MADDDKTEAEAQPPARRTQRDRGTAGATDEAPVQRPIPAPRTLTRTALEALRARLQRKFH
jgi:hypothetical protein